MAASAVRFDSRTIRPNTFGGEDARCEIRITIEVIAVEVARLSSIRIGTGFEITQPEAAVSTQLKPRTVSADVGKNRMMILGKVRCQLLVAQIGGVSLIAADPFAAAISP